MPDTMLSILHILSHLDDSANYEVEISIFKDGGNS